MVTFFYEYASELYVTYWLIFLIGCPIVCWFVVPIEPPEVQKNTNKIDLRPEYEHTIEESTWTMR